MHPGYYPSQTLSPSHQMASLRAAPHPAAAAASQSSAGRLHRPAYLQVDVGQFSAAPHMPSPTFATSPHHYLLSPHFALNSPVGASSAQPPLVPRPPPVVTASHDAIINEQTIRSLQERVTQLASVPRMTMQDLVNMQNQHITPRNVAQEGMRTYINDITHLNPPGSVRPTLIPQGAKYGKGPLLPGGYSPEHVHGALPASQQIPASSRELFMAMPQSSSSKASSHSSARYIGPTEEELRKLQELMPKPDDPDSKKSVEEWKKFRLRVMSRLRKQRWRAKKKAEVLAGDESTQKEEAERKRRDRLRKQEQRAKKKQRPLEEDQSSSYGDGTSNGTTPSPSPSPEASASTSVSVQGSSSAGNAEEENAPEAKPDAKPEGSSSSAEVPGESQQYKE